MVEHLPAKSLVDFLISNLGENSKASGGNRHNAEEFIRKLKDNRWFGPWAIRLQECIDGRDLMRIDENRREIIKRHQAEYNTFADSRSMDNLIIGAESFIYENFFQAA